MQTCKCKTELHYDTLLRFGVRMTKMTVLKLVCQAHINPELVPIQSHLQLGLF